MYTYIYIYIYIYIYTPRAPATRNVMWAQRGSTVSPGGYTIFNPEYAPEVLITEELLDM